MGGKSRDLFFYSFAVGFTASLLFLTAALLFLTAALLFWLRRLTLRRGGGKALRTASLSGLCFYCSLEIVVL